MARVTTVKRSQKDQGRCEKCGKDLPAGSAYKWCAPRAGSFARGHRRVRCLDCPSWRPSETTSSSARSAVYGAQEAAEDRLSDWDREDAEELRSILTDAAEGVREGAECYRESQSNMESGFGTSTSISDELGEKADTLESAADELESAESDIEDFEVDDARAEALSEFSVWVLRNKDGSLVSEELTWESDTDADMFLDALVRDGLGSRDDIDLCEEDASDIDFDLLPESVRDAVEDKVVEVRDAWADEQADKVSDALGNIEIP